MTLTGRLILLLVLLGFTGGIRAEEPKGGDNKQSIARTPSNDQTDFISINSVLMWIGNSGMTAHNPLTDASGLEWPNGSGKYAIFTDGLIWGGTVQGNLRVGGATYRYGMQAGPIKADGTAADPSDPKYKIYKVRKVDATTFLTMGSAEQTRLREDFMDWPAIDGAPYMDKDKNGRYEPNFDDWLVNGDKTTYDTPWFIGDEVLWFVSNDLDATRTGNLYGTAPIGLEIHTMVWGYNQTGPLGNMVFTKYTIINKGVNDFENAYLSKWTDPDLGDANDDFCGVDTTLALGYVYNALASDGVYGIPPAAGYDFFQGPIVAGEPADIATYNFGKRPGFRNLGVTSFVFYVGADAVYLDPELGKPGGATQMYNYMQSKLDSGAPFIDPNTGDQVMVCLAGDPITKTGWIDGQVRGPGDRRFLMTTGPFTLAAGDSQEVVVATIVGRGSDRLSSVQVLKYYDRFAQLAFENNFGLPKAPPQPQVLASLLPHTIVLHWGDPDQVKTIERFADCGYTFQGYNVYQFPTRASTLADAKRIATYDKVDNIATIFDEVIDEKSGAIVSLPVQFGNDVGILHSITLTNDAITDRPLVNNQPYYYAVTAYSYNGDPDVVPRTAESQPVIIEARPQTTNPGVRLGFTLSENVPVTHTSGSSTGEVLVEAVDPLRMTGDTYEVSFTSLGTVIVDYEGTPLEFDNCGSWNLRNLSQNRNVVVGDTNLTGLERNNYVIDGFKIGVSGSGHYVYGEEILKREWKGGPPVYEAVTDGDWQPGYFWPGSSINCYDITQVVQIRFNRKVTSKGYNYLRGASPPYSCQGYFDNPFTIWDISTTPERQLQFAFVEQINKPSNNNIWAPTSDLNDREWLVILNDTYSDTPSPTYMGYLFSRDVTRMPIIYGGWYLQKPGIANAGAVLPWRDGDTWTITPNVAFSAADKYMFTTTQATYSSTVASQDVTKINVFPNPYLGTNAQELNTYQRFVTFNHLPPVATFRIYTLSGTLVRSFQKNNSSQIANWDLLNDNQIPVGSGMYIIHIDMPDLKAEKILKLGIVAEQQYMDRI